MEARFKSYNQKGDIRIRHILIEELLASEVSIDFELVHDEPFQSNLFNTLKRFTQKNKYLSIELLIFYTYNPFLIGLLASRKFL